MAARRNQPNVIKSNSFKLEKALSKNDLKRLLVKSTENALDNFIDDHQNQPVCLQFFYLDDSNLHITSSKLEVQGKLFQSEPKLIKATNLWAIENDQVMVKFTNIECSAFTFSDSLASDYLDHKSLEGTSICWRNGDDLSPEELGDLEIDGFSLRLFVAPASGTTAKLLLGMYPLSLETLKQECRWAESPAFPCLVLTRMEVGLGIDSRQIFDHNWGSPSCPIFVAKTPLGRSGEVVKTEEILSKQAALLRATGWPEVKKNTTTLAERWTSISQNGENNLKATTPDIIWPERQASGPETDNSSSDGERESDSSLTGVEGSVTSLAERAREEIQTPKGASNQDGEGRRKSAERAKKPRRKAKKRPMVLDSSDSDDSGQQADNNRNDQQMSSASGKKDSQKKKARNSELLKELWAEEDRPSALKSKRLFDSMSMEDLAAIYRMKMEKDKAEGEEEDNLKDEEYPVTMFDAQEDDRRSKIHKASLLRLPLADPGAIAEFFPVKLKPVVRNLALEFSGGQNKISSKTIELAHNRGKALSLKHFFSGNLGVMSRNKCKTTKIDGNTTKEEVDYNWDSPGTLQHIQEAFINHGMLMQELFPWDKTPIIFERVLNKYKWLMGCTSMELRKGIITDYFNSVLKENSANAVNKRVYMSFVQHENCLKEVMIKNGVAPNVPLPRVNLNNDGRGRGSGARFGAGMSGREENKGRYNDRYNERRTNDRGNGGGATSFPLPKFNNQLVCFAYNSTNGKVCSNLKTEDGGCKTRDNKRFAHVCSFFLKDQNKHCFKRHAKKDHR